MRLRSFVALVSLFAGSSVAAQESRGAIRIGVLAGVNLATLDANSATRLDNRTGLVAGVFVVRSLGTNWGIQTEGLFSMKGAALASANATATEKIDYLEVPVLLRYEVPVSRGVKPFAYVGPSASLKTACDIEAHGQGGALSLSCDEAVRQFGKPGTSAGLVIGDIGGVVGGGLAFDVSGRILTVSLRYEAGFVGIATNDDSKNRVLSFVGTFELPFGR
jgi:Outer membrane protein beta-barrel domain